MAVLLFFAGGIAREINMEGKLGCAEDDTELRRQYERRHITSKPLLPNLMVVIGLILIFGVSTTVIKAFDNSQLDQSFYQVLNVALAAVGIAMSVTGFYLKTKTKDKQTTHDHPA